MTNDAPARTGRIRSATIDCFPPNGVPYPKFLVRGSSWRVFDGHALRARITEKLLVCSRDEARSGRGSAKVWLFERTRCNARRTERLKSGARRR
jgi:hypothetical protein